MKATVSGIRGVAGEDLLAPDVARFCSGFAALAGPQCAVGRDTRPSGPAMQQAAAAGLLQSGTSVIDYGVCPTPAVFWESRRCGAGVIVTSSHNPLEWNGLKFAVSGMGASAVQMDAIASHEGPPAGDFGSESAAESGYAQAAAEAVGAKGCGADVIVDAGGGSAALAAPQILEAIGCSVRTINMPGSSARGPDPTADPLDALASASRSCKAGFAFDLDGDRLVLAYGGKTQSPDATLGLGVAWALGSGLSRFVISIDTSVAVERMILEGGGTCRRSAVGEANVVQMIIEAGAQAGGEGSSGGFILPEFNCCRDGMLAAGLIASMEDSQIREALGQLGGYFARRTSVRAASADHGRIMQRLAASMQKAYSQVVEIDGIKGIVDEHSWVLVRKSNTEDLLRISAESNDAAKAEQLAAHARKMVVDAAGP